MRKIAHFESNGPILTPQNGRFLGDPRTKSPWVASLCPFWATGLIQKWAILEDQKITLNGRFWHFIGSHRENAKNRQNSDFRKKSLGHMQIFFFAWSDALARKLCTSEGLRGPTSPKMTILGQIREISDFANSSKIAQKCAIFARDLGPNAKITLERAFSFDSRSIKIAARFYQYRAKQKKSVIKGDFDVWLDIDTLHITIKFNIMAIIDHLTESVENAKPPGKRKRKKRKLSRCLGLPGLRLVTFSHVCEISQDWRTARVRWPKRVVFWHRRCPKIFWPSTKWLDQKIRCYPY